MVGRIIKMIKVILYKETGEIEEIEAENLYHAQNILILSFTILDEKMYNDVVFGRIEAIPTIRGKIRGKILEKEIFAFHSPKGIIVRNTTKEFMNTYKDVTK